MTRASVEPHMATDLGASSAFHVYTLLPPFQILSHSKNLGESKHFLNLTKVIDRNTKICNIKWVYYENIIKKESNDT